MKEHQELTEKIFEDLKFEYLNLVDSMAELSPEEWEKLYFFGRIEEDISESNFWIKNEHKILHPNQYIRINGDLKREKAFNYLNKIIKNICEIFEKNSQPIFTEIKFVVTSKGIFNINFSYEKIKDDNYFSEKFQNWKKEIEKEEFGKMGSRKLNIYILNKITVLKRLLLKRI